MNTTDSAGKGRVGWVSPHGGRSTWEIIWSCFTVFLICSWKCTHLNVPSTKESCAGWHRLHRMPVWPSVPLMRKWGRKLMWMGIMALAPELVVGVALTQFFEAREKLVGTTSDKFTLTHAFFANMGGFALRIYTRGNERLQEPFHRPDSAEEPSTGSRRSPHITSFHEVALNLEDIASLQDLQFISDISEADIQDRSKADAFTKAFALCQSGWIVLQTVTRAAQRLAITQLELVTAAFVFCAFFAYLVWWYKPFDVERRHIIMCHASQVTWGGEKIIQSDNDPKFNLSTRSLLNDESRVDDFDGSSSDGLLWLLIFNHSGKDHATTIGLYLIGAAFSAIHLGAWNFEFPSLIIQRLWRVFSIISVGTSLACIPMVFVRKVAPREDVPNILIFGLFMLLFVAYGLSRVALLVLTFYCFTSMPTSVYDEIDWLEFLPRFS